MLKPAAENPKLNPPQPENRLIALNFLFLEICFWYKPFKISTYSLLFFDFFAFATLSGSLLFS